MTCLCLVWETHCLGLCHFHLLLAFMYLFIYLFKRWIRHEEIAKQTKECSIAFQSIQYRASRGGGRVVLSRQQGPKSAQNIQYRLKEETMLPSQQTRWSVAQSKWINSPDTLGQHTESDLMLTFIDDLVRSKSTNYKCAAIFQTEVLMAARFCYALVTFFLAQALTNSLQSKDQCRCCKT